MFGKLSLDAVPFHEPIVMVTIAGIILGGLALVGLITYFGKWTYLWKEWLTSVDHKRLGIMYIIVAIVMLLRGFADAIMMRSQQALASAGEAGFLPPHHYDQIFTAHGVIMIFFVAMPFVIGLMNLVVPLQIGARDVAFPFLNNLSFWFTVVGVILVNVSLGVGEFAQTGWLAYPPLSGIEYSPSRCRLLDMESPAIRYRYDAYRYQLLRYHSEDARTGHDHVQDASIYLGITVRKRTDYCFLPNSDGYRRVVDPGSLSGHPFLYQRYGWQHDDVYQPDLGLGPPGSLHLDPACIRCVLRNCGNLLA